MNISRCCQQFHDELAITFIWLQIKMGGVLSSLGTFKIWVNLIVIPILLVFLGIGFFYFQKHQRGWIVTNATTTSACDDSCTVTLPGVQGTYTLKMTDEKGSKGTTPSGSQLQVTYDPNNISGTLTTVIFTSSTRRNAEIFIGIAFLLFFGYWILNFELRNNNDWKNISGAMEVGDIASGALGMYRS
jgi:hypothetical protein